MKPQSSMLHVRMDAEMKRKATTALTAMGLTPSEAVRLLFHRIAVDQAFPLELKVPNAQTRSAMAEVVTLAGRDGGDVKAYQEKAVRSAIREAQQ